jgi:hypothetical protein
MRPGLGWILAVLASLAAPVARSAPDCPPGQREVEWTSELGVGAERDLHAAMRSLAEPGSSGPGAPATCEAYLAARAGGGGLAPDADGEWSWHGDSWAQSKFLERCLALYLLSRGRAARSDCLGDFRLTPRSAQELPSTLGLVASTAEQRGMSEDRSLAAWAPEMRFEQRSATEIVGIAAGADGLAEEDHWSLLALGDLDGDGYQDALIAIRALSGGTYGELRLAILTRRRPDGLLSHAGTRADPVAPAADAAPEADAAGR